jgi:NAD(P)-dependent dehydrogenase (short-subunit alcohol dehydrogenase family)
MKHFHDRVAVVTGGASGIGFGMTYNFLKLGMKVAVIDFNDAHLADAGQKLTGEAVHFIRADVGDRMQVRSAAEETLRVFGKINVLCNNAGVGGGGDTIDPDFDAWDRTLRINFGGVVNGVKIITPMILSHGEGGHIVNTASMSGIVPLPLPGLGAYMTSKFAVRGFTESLRLSLAPHGIGVSCLFPGGTRTRIVEDSAADEQRQAEIRQMTASWMDPIELGAMVVEGIRNNSPYILTHEEFRDEVREIYQAIDAAFPKSQSVPPGRRAFEDGRRAMLKQLGSLPVKD